MSESIQAVCPSCGGINRLPAARMQEHPRCGKCHGELFPGTALAVDAAGFERQLTRGDVPLVVDFWAPWCGPCRTMAPAFEAAARELAPHFRLLKLNTEEEQALAGRYGIRSIPTLILFRDGREAARISGAMDASRLVAWVRGR